MGNGFFEVGRVAISFRSGPESMDFLDGRLPLPESTSPEKFRGGGRGDFNVPLIEGPQYKLVGTS